MKFFNRVISLLMVVLMLTASVPFTLVSAVENGTEKYTLTVENTYADSSFAESSAVGKMSFFGSAEFDGCYGNQLSGVARELYNSLVKSYVTDKMTGEYIYTFKTPFIFAAEVSGDYIVTNEELEEIKTELHYGIQSAMDAFLYDHPEVFWLKIISTSYSISASGNSVDGYTGYIEEITVIPAEIYSGASAKISQYASAVNSALDAITTTESRYGTLKSIHDYICNNAWYNLVNEQRVHSSEPFFIGDGGVVCEGYAKTFKVLCDRLGIPCVLVSGDAGGPHMWNYVRMDDGKWYLVDATWDDQKSQIYDTYFLAGANTVGFEDVAISEERSERTDFSGTGIFSFTYPALSSGAYTVHIHEWESDYTVDIEPTCTEKGSKSIHCKTCDETKSVTEIPAVGHDEISHEAKEPTCTEIGWDAYVTCSRCDYTTYSEIPSTKHKNKYIVDKVVPTCTSVGYEDGVYCPDCEKWIMGHEEIPVLKHEYVSHEYKAPTCTDVGWEEYLTCENCDYSTYVEIPVIEHIRVEQEGKAPTCTQAGYKEGVSCSVCNEWLFGHEEIPATGHLNEVLVKRTEPTCNSVGYTAGLKCVDCEEWTQGHEEIPALTHDMSDWSDNENGTHTRKCERVGCIYTETEDCTYTEWSITESTTCNEAGLKSKSCTVCGYTVTEAIEKLPHTPGEAVTENRVEAECEVKGSYDEVVYCSVCDTELSRTEKEIPAPGHDEISHDAKEPTCTEIGWDAYVTCSRCNYTTYTEKEALGHSYEAAVTEPTCTKGGYTTYTCTCGDSYIADEVSALGHTEDEAVTENEVPATCTAEGTYDAVVYCTVCGEELSRETVTTEKLGHSYEAAVTAPTCTEGGYTTYTCTCGDSYIADEVPALGHTEGEAVTENEVPATCTAEGTYDAVVYCTVCGEELGRETVTTEKLGHSYEAAVTAPTCTEVGYITYTCTCGDSYIADEVSALGHTEGEAVTENEVPATCTAEGTYDAVVYCTVCGEELSRETVTTEKLGHSYEAAVTEPTCTEVGYTTYTCICGDSYIADEVPALGHTEEGLSAVDATCEKTGLTAGIKCSVCGEALIEQTEIPALGHDYEVTDHKPATCKEDGYKTYICKNDNSHAYTGIIKATGHHISNVNAKEPTCGEKGWEAYRICKNCDYTTYKELPATGKHTGGKATCKDKAKCIVCGQQYGAVLTVHTGSSASCVDKNKCKICGVTFGTVDKSKHKSLVVIPAVEATYKAAGKTAGQKCSSCGEITVKQNTVAKKTLGKTTSLKAKSVTLAKASSVALTWKKVDGAEKYEIYQQSGKKWKKVGTTSKTTLTIKKLTAGKSYKFKVRATLKGEKSGAYSSVLTVKVVPFKTTLSLKAGKKQLTASWKKVSGITGYEVQCSTSKKFTSKTTKKVTIKKAKTVKTTVKKLSKGKKYFVRVRAYKTVGNKNYYGAWSTVKNVKVK